uniref:Sugar phosphate phosphatase n=1 Tax=Globisporangium ultimum (strain ATCC 200006 / CBS 805.95 / DAOM BR144) TaxID=431595 RepID=K3WZW1_GLOUD
MTPPPSSRRTTTPAFLAELAQQELLWTNVPGTFANESYVERLPALVDDVARRNRARLSAQQLDALAKLANDMKQDAVIPMPASFGEEATLAPLTPHWNQVLDGHGYTWQNSPWFLSEQYMFHVVLLIAGYYSTGIDPFHPSKAAELSEGTPWNLLQSAVELSAADAVASRHEQLKRFIKLCLWGNKADGCYTVVKDTISGENASLAIDDKYLLVDHSDKVITFLENLAVEKKGDIAVQYINDNCGTELLLDLALADHLITHSWSASVTFNVKAEPMYVSDATPPDVLEHIAAMQDASRSPEIQALGNRLAGYVQTNKVRVVPDLFWNHYSFYYEMPEPLAVRLNQEASLVILKGDLNYRRLLGDRMWPATTPVERAIPYFPAPFVSFRTLKSNPIVGIPAEVEKELDAEDPKWRWNGVRGTIMSVL